MNKLILRMLSSLDPGWGGGAVLKKSVGIDTIKQARLTNEYIVCKFQMEQGEKVFWCPSARTKPSETRVVH